MTEAERIASLLDEADVFIRNRVNSVPATLNAYDIEVLIDISNVCDEAANIIRHQSAQLEKLKRREERWHSLLGFGE